MPRVSNHLSLARQWELLKRLPARAPGITARELADRLKEDGYPVTKRTIERDLVDLSIQFGIACNDSSKPFGWHWMPGKQYEFASVELVDAVSLCLASEVLERMLPSEMLTTLRPKLEQAKRKLDALREHPLVRLPEKLRYVPAGLDFCPPSIKPGILQSLQDALISERQIEAVYAPFNAKAKALRLHPLSLIQRGPVPYLVATAFDFADVRLYAVQRFESVEITSQTIRTPKNYSLDRALEEGLAQFGGGDNIRLKAQLSNELAIYLSETPLSAEQKIQYKNGSWQLTALLRDSWQLQFWILSQGAGITVLSPKSLKERIQAQLKQALEQYG
jgi:predicted DNA-binding transcriptional regulator YafY